MNNKLCGILVALVIPLGFFLIELSFVGQKIPLPDNPNYTGAFPVGGLLLSILVAGLGFVSGLIYREDE